jgi:hypothetical protein
MMTLGGMEDGSNDRMRSADLPLRAFLDYVAPRLKAALSLQHS